jgi:predicted RNA-binding protein with PUA-like domain
MPKNNYWLMKSEPETFSIFDFKNLPAQTSCWEGVRNYQARNFMKEMKKGDLVFIYHSVKEPVGIFGIGVVAKEHYPDPFQFEPESKYYDAKATKEKPIWVAVDIKLKETFHAPITLKAIKENQRLSEMLVVQKGSRLSIQPVEERHWIEVLKMLN